MLFDPARHEPLRASTWDEALARDTIGRIVAEAERVFDPERLWPEDPLDRFGSRSLYDGAAGVIWAIDFLAEQSAVRSTRDWSPIVEALHSRPLAGSDADPLARDGYAHGAAGVALVGHRVTRSGVWIERALACAASNLEHPSNELFRGTPGTLLASVALHEATGDPRLLEVAARSRARVLARLVFEPERGCKLWTQDSGAPEQGIGLAHGFAGNACALLRAGAAAQLESDVERTLEATARIEGGLANWPQSAGPPRSGREAMRVQVCHGAPGVIVALARLEPRHGSRLEELLRMGGELTFRAGPLAKGSSLCHGTAGSGYAFLCLYRRSGERVWLERARSFGMHAIGQWRNQREARGRGRFSLWTGDAGLACFLWDCVRERDEFPTVHAF